VNTPVLLLGATIAFWGWQTEEWFVAACCVLIFEGARLVPRRFAISPALIARISDFCVVLTALLFVVLYVSLGNPRAITRLFLWLPVTLMPLALAQCYGEARTFELGTLFRSMRALQRRQPVYVNLGYSYAALWVIAASAANSRGPGFELGVILLASWALWHVRPRSSAAWIWLLLIPLAGALAYAGHSGLHTLQGWMEANAADWLRGDGDNTDPYRADTDIGHIGRLKESERIIMRVHPERVLMHPLLLHRATYTSYTGLRWLARRTASTAIDPDPATGTWRLRADAGGTALAKVDIVDQSDPTNVVLSLPAGVQRVEGLSADTLKISPLGTVQIMRNSAYLAYRAWYDSQSAGGAAPGGDDLVIPRLETESLRRVAEELGLQRMTAAQAATTLQRWFDEHFTYTVVLPRTDETSFTAMAEFLTRTRRGHCEYFATATVLLLRAAGIPARYATGFSVQEWSDLDRTYVVRARHAHAWARVWMDGQWRDVDTTPASWWEAEQAARPWWSKLADVASWLRMRLGRAQIAGGTTQLVYGVALAVLLWVSWRLFGKSRTRVRRVEEVRSEATVPGRGLDSAFYRIEVALNRAGLARASSETMREWLTRIAVKVHDADELAALVDLHYRMRFDPVDLREPERRAFATRVDAWLARLEPVR
jgi:transglutaminase-like putative cysteine protease